MCARGETAPDMLSSNMHAVLESLHQYTCHNSRVLFDLIYMNGHGSSRHLPYTKASTISR